MRNHNLTTKDQKNRWLSHIKQADHLFDRYSKTAGNRTKRRELSRQDKRRQKHKKKLEQQLHHKQHSKPLREQIQVKMRLANNSSANTANNIEQNKSHTNHSHALSQSSKHHKFRRKYKRIRPAHDQISFNNKFLLFLAISMILLPVAGAINNAGEKLDYNGNQRFRFDDQDHSSNSLSPLPPFKTNSLINDSAPILTNPFSSATVDPIKPAQSLQECHLLWTRTVQDKSSTRREKLCFRKLTDPNPAEYNRAINLAVEALIQNDVIVLENIVTAWPVTTRIELIKEFHQYAQFEPPQFANTTENEANELDDFQKLVPTPHYKEVLSAYESVPWHTTHYVELDNIKAEFDIIPDSDNTAYYELQQDLFTAMQNGDQEIFTRLFSLGVKVPKLGNPVTSTENYPESILFLKYIETLFKHYSALSAMIVHAPSSFVQYVVNNTPAFFPQKELDNEIVIAAVWGIEDVLKILCHRPTSEIIEAMNSALIMTMELPNKENVVKFLLEKGVDLQKIYIRSTSGDHFLFSYLLSYCKREYIPIILKYCPNCVREYAKQTGTSLIHLYIINNDVEIVKLMLELDPTLIRLRDKHGRNTLVLINENTDPELVTILKNAEKNDDYQFFKKLIYWTVLFSIVVYGVTVAVKSNQRRSIQRMDKELVNKLLESTQSRLQLLTKNILTNPWLIKDGACVLDLNFIISPKLPEIAKKVDARLNNLSASSFNIDTIKTNLSKVINELNGVNAVKITGNQLLIKMVTIVTYEQGQLLRYAKELEKNIIKNTAEYQALLLIDNMNQEKMDLAKRKEKTVSENKRNTQAIEKQIQDLNTLLTQLIEEKNSAARRQNSENDTIKKYANSVVSRYETLEKGITDIQQQLKNNNKACDDQIQSYDGTEHDLAQNENKLPEILKQQKQIVSQLEKTINATASLLDRLNLVGTSFNSLKEAIASFKNSQKIIPDNDVPAKTVQKMKLEQPVPSSQKQSTMQQNTRNTKNSKNSKKEKLPAITREDAEPESSPAPTATATSQQNEALQTNIPKPESNKPAAQIIFIPGNPVLPFFNTNLAAAASSSQSGNPKKSDVNPVSDQPRVPSYKQPERPSMLNQDEIRNIIKYYGEAISEMVASVNKYDFNNSTERGIYRYALSYYLLRMCHCMWLETLADNADPALEEPKQIRLIRHMLAHLPNAASNDILFSTAVDIRTHFLCALLKENNKPINKDILTKMSKKDMQLLATRCNFNATDLYHTLKPKWDNQDHLIGSAEHCFQEIQNSANLIKDILKPIRSTLELSHHSDRLDAVKMLITIIGEHLNILQQHHRNVWEEMLKRDKRNIFSDCIKLRNRVCHFVHKRIADIPPEVYRFAGRLEENIKEILKSELTQPPLIRHFVTPSPTRGEG